MTFFTQVQFCSFTQKPYKYILVFIHINIVLHFLQEFINLHTYSYLYLFANTSTYFWHFSKATSVYVISTNNVADASVIFCPDVFILLFPLHNSQKKKKLIFDGGTGDPSYNLWIAWWPSSQTHKNTQWFRGKLLKPTIYFKISSYCPQTSNAFFSLNL